MKNVVLVLGAGSSKFLGYPLGSELRKMIINYKQSANPQLLNGFLQPHELYKIDSFIEEFKKSHINSIDAFLAHRSEFSDIGKKIITHLILSKEDKKLMDNTPDEDNWYRYLLNEFIKASWDELDLAWLKIVTFNYDRSLEYFLINAFKSAYNKPIEDVIQKLKDIEIVHVYGCVSENPLSEISYNNFGQMNHPQSIISSAKNIKVIPEARDDSDEFKIAQQLLLNADQIAFLGFGYDYLNLRRLNSNITCKNRITRGVNDQSRFVYGTCFGLTRAERMDNLTKTAGNSYPGDPENHFPDCNVTTLFRNTLILQKN